MDSLRSVRAAVGRAAEHLLSIQRTTEPFWCAEFEFNVSATSMYVMLAQILGLHLPEEREKKIINYLIQHQKSEDGSWSMAFGIEGDISLTTEAYLALTILGLDADDFVLSKAKSFILSKGGLSQVSVFTKIALALFGILPWTAVPPLPAEMILLPSQLPVALYRFASWARCTMVPLLVISHHRPVYKLPNEACHKLIMELWLPHAERNVPYLPPVRQVLMKNGISWKSFFCLIDPLVRIYEEYKPSMVRKYAIKKCMEYILKHQENEGDTAGIIPPLLYNPIAMTLQGYSLGSKEVTGCVQAIERFSWETHGQYRIQASVGPVWDTAFSVTALLDCGWSPNDARIEGAVRWMLDRQLLVEYGDWKIYRPKLESGGWSFQYFNSWFPDVDDTATVVISLLKQSPDAVQSHNIHRALRWLLGMQNKDGGWAAYDVDNDKLFLNDHPASDMGALCDPSTPDVAGHVLEAVGLYLELSEQYKHTEIHRRLRSEAETGTRLGIQYLRDSQELQGSWYGRWAVNYIFGTCGSLCGLAAVGVPMSDPMVSRAIEWLKWCQNKDGGWGEGVNTYKDKSQMGKGIESTPSQTAWSLMGLLAYLPPEDMSIQSGIQWLLRNIVHPSEEPAESYEGGLPIPTNTTTGGTWNERHFTGTGFPKHTYVNYHLYRHYFPMMALGRYLRSSEATARLGISSLRDQKTSF
ncbi:squalene-hopene/tetraprenyl-beta-curcumene cyclase [Marchantia polymorpha subsp. ruderalis]